MCFVYHKKDGRQEYHRLANCMFCDEWDDTLWDLYEANVAKKNWKDAEISRRLLMVQHPFPVRTPFLCTQSQRNLILWILRSQMLGLTRWSLWSKCLHGRNHRIHGTLMPNPHRKRVPGWSPHQKGAAETGTIHPSIHILFRLRCCPCPILYVEHQLSLHLWHVGQRQLSHTYWHQSSHIQTMSSEAFLSF